MSKANGILAFLDCETTGLDPDVHKIWQVYVRTARWDGHGLRTIDSMEVLIEMTRADLLYAEPEALRINRFHEVHAQRMDEFVPAWTEETVKRLWEMLHSTTIVGAVPSFDTERLAKVFKKFGYMPEWHHRLVCVETLAAVKLGVLPPWSPRDLAERLGIERDPETMHDARYDVTWAMNMFEGAYR